MHWIRATATIDIERPIDEVFAWVSSPANLGVWLPGVREGRITSLGPLGEGTTLSGVYGRGSGAPRFDYVVTGFDPPQRFALRATGGPFPMEAALDLRARGENRTRLRNTTRAASDGLLTELAFTALGPLLRRQVARRLERCLAALRADLEGRLQQSVRDDGMPPELRGS